jgi:hypothetical protein
VPFGLILFLFLLLTAEDAESAEGFRLSNKFREKSKMLSLASLGHTGRSPSVVEVLVLVECRCRSEVECRLVSAVIHDKNRPCIIRHRNASQLWDALQLPRKGRYLTLGNREPFHSTEAIGTI